MAWTIQSILGLDISQFRRAAAAASATLGGVASEARSQFGDLGNQLLGGLTVGGAVYYLQSVANEMDEVGKASRRTGVDTQSWQYLVETFKRGDASAQDLEVALKKLKQQAAVALETNDQTGVFAKLGLDFKVLKDMSPDQMLLTVADAINKLPSAWQRSSAAQEFFGRNGEKVLDSLVNEYKAIKSWMDDNQLVIGDAAIASAAAYNDQLENMVKRFQALAANSGIFNTLADWFDQLDYETRDPKKQADQLGVLRREDEEKKIRDQVVSEKYAMTSGLAPDDVFKLQDVEVQRRMAEKGWKPSQTTMAVKSTETEVADRKDASDARAEEMRQRREAAEKKASNDAVQSVVDKQRLEQQKASGGGKLSAEAEAQAEILAIEKALNRELDEEQKKRIRNAVEAKKTAEAAAELAKAQKKLAESLDGKFAGMRETLLESMGQGQQAAIERSMREAEKAKGAPLDDVETARAVKAGKLEYAIANLKQQAAALPELEMSDMTRANGGAILESSAMEQINQDILAESKTASQLLQQLNDKFDDLGKVSN